MGTDGSALLEVGGSPAAPRAGFGDTLRVMARRVALPVQGAGGRSSRHRGIQWVGQQDHRDDVHRIPPPERYGGRSRLRVG